MKINSLYLKISLLFFLSNVIISCKKQVNKSLIDNTLPNSDIINAQYIDTFSFFLKTERIDSVKIYNDGFKYIGSNQDPVFGRTDAELYSHFSLPNNVTNIQFPSDAVVDSAKIILVFTENFVGDTAIPQRYQVYLLNENLVSDTTYYSNKTFTYINTPLADIEIKPVEFSGFKTIQIPVYKDFVQSIISNSQYLVNNDIFQNTYKGFYITTKNTLLNSSTSQGALMKIDLANTISGLYVYYHTGNPPALKESKVYQFTFNNNNTVKVNHFNYNYSSGANVYLYNQLTGNLSSCPQLVFVKGLNGCRIKVDIPALKTLHETWKNIAINRAEVVFKVDKSFISSSYYEPPLGMSLLALDSAGNEVFTVDQYYSETYPYIAYDGYYNSSTGEYKFNISRYMQHLLSGKTKYYGLVLVATDPKVTLTARKDFFAARAVLGGHQNTLLKPQLKIYYTIFP